MNEPTEGFVILSSRQLCHDYTWCSYKIVDWVSDIQTRINKVQIESKKSKLAQLEDRLNKIISPELRAKLELEAIANELS